MFLLIDIIELLFQIYFYMIFAYVLMSWLPQLRESSLGELLGKFVEPYLAIFRRFIPPIGMLDLSAMVGLFALMFIQRGLITVITLLFGFVS